MELLRVEQLEKLVAAYNEKVRHLEQEKQALLVEKLIMVFVMMITADHGVSDDDHRRSWCSSGCLS